MESDQQAAARVAERILQTVRPLTAILNTALELLMKDDSLKDTTRLLFCVWRSSWGNWSAYAIESQNRGLGTMPDDIPEDLRPMLRDTVRLMILGPGKCPGCGKMPSNRSRRDIHRQFRWHVNCLAKAFATDAIAISRDPEVERWARDVLADKPVQPQSEVIQ